MISRAHTELSRLLTIRHIAIFGASRDPAKWGNAVVAGLLKSGYRDQLTLVNPEGGEVHGLSRVPAAHAFGADLAVIATPAPTVPDLLRQCAQLNIPIAVVIAGGFGESGNSTLDDRLRDALRETGVRLLGPNCLGIVVGSRGINTTSFELPFGSVSIVAQSGGFIQAAGFRLAELGGGFDIGLSLGNKVDVNFTNAIRLILEAQTSSSIMMYLERFDEGDEFLDTLAEASSVLPVTALVAGRTEAGTRAARSHTDSLIGRWDRVTGLLRDSGVEVVDRITDAVAVAVGGQSAGRRPLSSVFVLSDGGAGAVLLADAIEGGGYCIEPPTEGLSKGLSKLLQIPNVSNPLDTQGRAETDLTLLLEASRLILESEEYDALVIGGILGGYGRVLGARFSAIEEQIARALPTLAKESDRPIVVQSMYATTNSAPLEMLRSCGVACVEWPEEAVQVLRSRTAERHRPTPQHHKRPRDSEPNLDPSLAALIQRVVASLELRNVPHALGELVGPNSPAVEGPGPWVVKADGFPHKVDAGAIKLKVTEDQLDSAIQQMREVSRAAGLEPQVRVAPYIQHEHELVVTFWHNMLEGSGCMIGAGGSAIEGETDVAIGRIPLEREDVQTILGRTKIGTRLLTECPTIARRAVDVALALARIFQSDFPDMREIEFNPVGLTYEAAVVLDALPSPR